MPNVTNLRTSWHADDSPVVHALLLFLETLRPPVSICLTFVELFGGSIDLSSTPLPHVQLVEFLRFCS